jgi:hypothetical protein
VDADAVEDFRMADDFKAGLRGGRGSRRAKISRKRGTAPRPETTISWRAQDGGRGAQVGVDGEVGGGVAGGLVFNQGLLQQCVDAVLFQSIGQGCFHAG